MFRILHAGMNSILLPAECSSTDSSRLPDENGKSAYKYHGVLGTVLRTRDYVMLVEIILLWGGL